LSWLNRHSRVPLSIEVGPPSAKSVMWCNAAKLGCYGDADLGRARMSPAAVVGAFAGVVFGEMPLDYARIGAVAPPWVQHFQYLGNDCRSGSAVVVRGKSPPAL
jgi:hypothetical protein